MLFPKALQFFEVINHKEADASELLHRVVAKKEKLQLLA
jgi:hypothetical protein